MASVERDAPTDIHRLAKPWCSMETVAAQMATNARNSTQRCVSSHSRPVSVSLLIVPQDMLLEPKGPPLNTQTDWWSERKSRGDKLMTDFLEAALQELGTRLMEAMDSKMKTLHNLPTAPAATTSSAPLAPPVNPNHSYQSGTPAASDAISEPLDDSNDSSDGTSIGSSTHDVSPNDVLTTFSVFNIRGLKPRLTPSKVGTISDLLYDSSQLFMALSETWLSEHHDAEIRIQGYSLFCQDRTQTKGKRGRNSAGVAVYVRDDAASNTEIILTFSNGVIEALGIHIKTWNLAVVIVYQTPDDPKHNRKSAEKEFSQFLKAARDCLKKTSSSYTWLHTLWGF